MYTSWKVDFLLPKGKELLEPYVYRDYAKLVSHERYVTKISRAKEVAIEHFEIIDYLNNRKMNEDIPSVEEMVITSIMNEKMMECLEKLNKGELFLIQELYFRNHHLSYCKIAQKLGIPRSTIQSRERKILDKLRKMLEG